MTDRIVTNAKAMLEQKISSLKMESDIIKSYMADLESKGFNWDEVTSTQYAVILDIIRDKVLKELQR